MLVCVMHFNTSYVVIKRKAKQIDILEENISIHLMLLLNRSVAYVI